MFRKTSIGLFLVTLICSMTLSAHQRGESPTTPVKIVDINSAPLDELETAVMNENLAKKIIENRPYTSKRQLLTRKLVSMEEYDEIKDRIIARRPGNSN